MKFVDKLHKYNDLTLKAFSIEKELNAYCTKEIRKIGIREFARRSKLAPSYISDIINMKRYFPNYLYKYFIETKEAE